MLATVALLAVVQSVFGVGLLVFGTPTPLLLGLPFLGPCLPLGPCSIVLSAWQILPAADYRWSRPAASFFRDVPCSSSAAPCTVSGISVEIS